MVMFADFGHRERASYFRDHSEALLNGRAKLIASLEAWARTIKACGAHERADFTVERFVADALDHLDGALPEEVHEYLGG